jgi:hypothetical protein
MANIPQRIFVCFNNPQPVEHHGTRGGSVAALSREVGARATGHVVAPDLL